MSRYPRILITGCARSGNTLLLHLFGPGFHNTRICHGERIPEKSACRPGWSIVGKRPGALAKLDRVLAQPDIGILFTMRDPRDCISSRHIAGDFWVKLERWVQCAEIIARHRDHPRASLVHFEQLLTDPAGVQAWLAARLGLTIRLPFVECWKEFDCRDSQGIKAMHGARPLDATRIGHWRREPGTRKRVAHAFAETPELPRWMWEFGYESGLAETPLPVAAVQAPLP